MTANCKEIGQQVANTIGQSLLSIEVLMAAYKKCVSTRKWILNTYKLIPVSKVVWNLCLIEDTLISRTLS